MFSYDLFNGDFYPNEEEDFIELDICTPNVDSPLLTPPDMTVFLEIDRLIAQDHPNPVSYVCTTGLDDMLEMFRLTPAEMKTVQHLNSLSISYPKFDIPQCDVSSIQSDFVPLTQLRLKLDMTLYGIPVSFIMSNPDSVSPLITREISDNLGAIVARDFPEVMPYSGDSAFVADHVIVSYSEDRFFYEHVQCADKNYSFGYSCDGFSSYGVVPKIASCDLFVGEIIGRRIYYVSGIASNSVKHIDNTYKICREQQVSLLSLQCIPEDSVGLLVKVYGIYMRWPKTHLLSLLVSRVWSRGVVSFCNLSTTQHKYSTVLDGSVVVTAKVCGKVDVGDSVLYSPDMEVCSYSSSPIRDPEDLVSFTQRVRVKPFVLSKFYYPHKNYEELLLAFRLSPFMHGFTRVGEFYEYKKYRQKYHSRLVGSSIISVGDDYLFQAFHFYLMFSRKKGGRIPMWKVVQWLLVRGASFYDRALFSALAFTGCVVFRGYVYTPQRLTICVNLLSMIGHYDLVNAITRGDDYVGCIRNRSTPPDG